MSGYDRVECLMFKRSTGEWVRYLSSVGMDQTINSSLSGAQQSCELFQQSAMVYRPPICYMRRPLKWFNSLFSVDDRRQTKNATHK